MWLAFRRCTLQESYRKGRKCQNPFLFFWKTLNVKRWYRGAGKIVGKEWNKCVLIQQRRRIRGIISAIFFLFDVLPV